MITTIRNRRKHSEEAGFTIIEIIVTMAILALLAAIAIPIYLNQTKTVKEKEVAITAQNLISLAISHKSSEGQYRSQLYDTGSTVKDTMEFGLKLYENNTKICTWVQPKNESSKRYHATSVSTTAKKGNCPVVL